MRPTLPRIVQSDQLVQTLCHFRSGAKWALAADSADEAPTSLFIWATFPAAGSRNLGHRLESYVKVLERTAVRGVVSGRSEASVRLTTFMGADGLARIADVDYRRRRLALGFLELAQSRRALAPLNAPLQGKPPSEKTSWVPAYLPEVLKNYENACHLR